jgi:hypothetical protein
MKETWLSVGRGPCKSVLVVEDHPTRFTRKSTAGHVGEACSSLWWQTMIRPSSETALALPSVAPLQQAFVSHIVPAASLAASDSSGHICEQS